MVDRKARATSFGPIAAAYERGRPDYPIEAVGWLLEGTTGLVLDVGAGTGKLTRTLSGMGYEVVAVDHDAAMLDLLRGETPSVASAVEAMSFRDGIAAGVVVAQAFHWFEQPHATNELARVLGPEGVLGLIWNLRDEEVDWVRQLSQLIGSEPIRDWDAPIEAHPGFAPVERAVFHHLQELDPETLVALVASRSYVSTKAPDERSRVLDSVRALCDEHPQLRGKRRFSLPYRTVAFRARRLAG